MCNFFFICGFFGLIDGWDVCVKFSVGKFVMEIFIVGGVCICCSGYVGRDWVEIIKIKVLYVLNWIK